MSIEPKLEKCGHLQVQYSRVLSQYLYILKRFSVRINFKSQFQGDNLPLALKYIKIASKLKSIVTILANIALASGHIFQVLAQYW